jgi:hypothetical protein
VTTWFCLECFEEVDAGAVRCRSCGSATSTRDRTYEEMLVRALSHRLPDRRILAAEILGRRRSQAATERLAALALDPADPYVQASAAAALAAIQPDHPVVRHLAGNGPVLVRDAISRGDPWG